MITSQAIQEAARLLHEAAKPAKVILFGSHARGSADNDSDADFLIIEPDVADRTRETLRLRKVIRPLNIANDILVYSQGEVEQKRDWSSSAIYWALREGKVLHDTLP